MENNFAVRQNVTSCSKKAYMSRGFDLTIRHGKNWGEKRIDRHGLFVDGFEKKSGTVFQFHESIGTHIPVEGGLTLIRAKANCW